MRILITLFLLASLSASTLAKASPPPAKPETHVGIAGAQWGSSPSKVKELFVSKYKFLQTIKGADGNVRHDVQYYSGNFAGFSTSKIEVTFIDERFSGFVAIIDPGAATVSRTWELVVEKMMAQYGTPKKTTPPPQTVLSGDFSKVLDSLYPDTKNKQRLLQMLKNITAQEKTAQYYVLDLMIENQTWKPRARWDFLNGIQCLVLAAPSAAGESIGGKMAWIFMTDTLFKALAAQNKSRPEF